MLKPPLTFILNHRQDLFVNFALMNETLRASILQVVEMTGDDLSLLLSCATRISLKKGDAVLEQGDICRSFYLVEQGYLRTWYNKDGVPININFTFEGNFACNLKSFRDRLPSELIIEAGEESVVWVFDIDKLIGPFEKPPQVSRFVRRLAVSLLLESEAHSDLFKIYTPTERYRQIEKNNPLLLQRVSLSQIASYLGVSRETLSRIRAKAV